MAVTFRDYSGDLVEAAHSVLLELVRLLGDYRDDLVVVGGWVPQLILPSEPLKHVGSIDVDLAFDLFVETEIRGELPGGGADQAIVRVSSVIAFLVMKGMALHDRLKEKDAWDISTMAWFKRVCARGSAQDRRQVRDRDTRRAQVRR